MFLNKRIFHLFQNEINIETLSSTGEVRRTKHFDFLLKKTEIFTHLINNNIKSSPIKPKERSNAE